MTSTAQPRSGPSLARWLVESPLLFLIVILLLRLVAVEPYGVPTGSMAVAVAGNHFRAECPRCGCTILVGAGDGTRPRHGLCPNCGMNIDLTDVRETQGDRLMVDKNTFELRRPRRWEPVVFRRMDDEGKAYVKRVVGRPGESLHILDGDLLINGELARKTLAQALDLAVPVVDFSYVPVPMGWSSRLEWQPDDQPGDWSVDGSRIQIDARPLSRLRWLTYAHRSLDTGQLLVLDDTLAYNGPPVRKPRTVHDFLCDADIEIDHGDGWLVLQLTDGESEVAARLPCFGNGVEPTAPPVGNWHTVMDGPSLPRNRRLTLTIAFVDRRVSLSVDGRVQAMVDLPPPAGQRPGVSRPLRLGVDGLALRIHQFRLSRDIHYVAQGRWAVESAYLLGADEYFMLGDNSAHSDDSRFWPTPTIRERDLMGKPFVVHQPSRWLTRHFWGRSTDVQAIDWSRIRWLR